jgi:hypothetical protein
MYVNRAAILVLGRSLGVVSAIAKINYAFLIRGVELYQPLILEDKYLRFILRGRKSSRPGKNRYQYVIEKILEVKGGDLHLDVGCNFGVIPLTIAQQGIYSIGVEFQYLSYLVAKEQAYLSRSSSANIINADIIEFYEKIPTIKTLSALSIVHHIVESFDNADLATTFLTNLFGKVEKRIVLEIASHKEGNYSWSGPNADLHGELEAEEWYTQFLAGLGFKVSTEVQYFDTHLGTRRPVLFADRVHSPEA